MDRENRNKWEFISNEFDNKLIFNEDVIGDKEITSENHIETGMFIPIAYPNDSKEVVGILRLINKTNQCEPKYVDYFNYEIDGKTMAIASKYLALVCNYYIRQDEQEIFINKLTHELNTPANAILKQADLLYKFRNDEGFIKRYQNTILEDIKSLAQMQKMQVDNNLLLSRRRKQLPLELKYNLLPHNLFGIIQDSKNIVIPIARRYNVQFEKIQIDNNLKQFTIRVDRHAFTTIFYNLLTNSIKYHDPNDEFRIFIGGRITNEVLRIIIADNGIGINKNEVNDIFNIGYRGENAIKLDAHGFGLGLSVIKQIIDDFDGNIHISHLKKPTIFIIELPKKIYYE